MKIVVGLGNFGEEYIGSRHNAGFMFLDALLAHSDVETSSEKIFRLEKKFESEILEVTIHGEKVILVKPQTYMNASGRAVSKILSYYKIDSSDLIVINDDMDLPVGIARVRQEGSSAGQKGLQDIIDSLGKTDFLRFRIGISPKEGREDKTKTVNFVLGKFSGRELPLVKEAIDLCVEYLLQYFGTNNPIPACTLGKRD